MSTTLELELQRIKGMEIEAREHQLKQRNNQIFQLQGVREMNLKKVSELEKN